MVITDYCIPSAHTKDRPHAVRRHATPDGHGGSDSASSATPVASPPSPGAGRRPVIAVTIGVEQAQWGAGWDGHAAILPMDYVRSVRAAGGLPVLVPPDEALQRHPDEILDIADGVLFAGGADIHPDAYGHVPSTHLEPVDPVRDRVELAVMRRALERDIPILGICRGFQLLNIASGGTLHQHLPDTLGHDHHRRRVGTFAGNHHPVTIASGSRIAVMEGASTIERASHHHQGVDTVGTGVQVTGRCTLDDLPEAIELTDRSFAVAVQWHPEVEAECTPIRGLVTAARERAPRAGAR